MGHNSYINNNMDNALTIKQSKNKKVGVIRKVQFYFPQNIMKEPIRYIAWVGRKFTVYSKDAQYNTVLYESYALGAEHPVTKQKIVKIEIDEKHRSITLHYENGDTMKYMDGLSEYMTRVEGTELLK